MKRALLPVILSFLVLASLAQADSAKRQEADALVLAGRTLLAQGNFAEAEKKLLAARDLDPRYPDIYSNLGVLYIQLKDKAKALDAFGQLLTLKPENEYGRNELKRLFYTLGKNQPGDLGLFPRQIRAPHLGFSGVSFTSDQVRLLKGSTDETQRIAYTTSMLFHEDMDRGSAPISVPLPVTGNTLSAEVNRSCYGFTMAPQSDRYTMAFALSYPSDLLEPHRNFSALSAKLTHMLLRFSLYGKGYLGLSGGLPESTAVKAYLCKNGPAGAESYQNSIFFYDVGTERSSVEWARQAAHELGHLLLPPVGRFQRPEAFASGYLGERLLMQYLALEAGLVSGDPWPSAAAQKSVNALWPGEEFKLEGYIAASCRPSLDYWLTAGPDSPLQDGSGEDAMQYYIGSALWTQAAFGTETLRQVLKSDSASPVPQKELLASLKQLLTKAAERGSLELSAGSINLAASRLATKPLEGALGRTQVRLTPGDSATFTMYLPAGAWTVQTGPTAEGLSLTVDGKGPLPFTGGDVSLGRVAAGWHTLVIQPGEKTPEFVLEKLLFKVEKEA
jgi:hypothetical protein